MRLDEARVTGHIRSVTVTPGADLSTAAAIISFDAEAQVLVEKLTRTTAQEEDPRSRLALCVAGQVIDDPTGTDVITGGQMQVSGPESSLDILTVSRPLPIGSRQAGPF